MAEGVVRGLYKSSDHAARHYPLDATTMEGTTSDELFVDDFSM